MTVERVREPGAGLPLGRPRPTAARVQPRAGAVGPAAMLALQRTAGNAAVQRLVQLAEPPRAARVLKLRERQAFVDGELTARRDRADARRVIEDMAGTSDVLDFSSRTELRNELIKRVTMTQVMRDSQAGSGLLAPFGYPFTGASLYWGPRVGFAARDYWVPPTPDDYDLRRDPVKRTELRRRPRGERHLVFGDQGNYRFTLSPLGAADPYQAIVTLFVPQAPHKRTLVHCDYLVSLVHFRAFMATLGKAAFNARIAAYGAANIQLRWDLFSELEPQVTTRSGATRPGLNSIRQVIPASPRDLVIGDHVYFWNHPAYDVINRNIGNAWRLENAVLVLRSNGNDVFLGHGSGRKTAAQMKAKLAEEYNDVATIALRLVQRTRRGSLASRAAARAELAARFGVVQVGQMWRVKGTGLRRVAVDTPLALLRASQIPGLFDPANPSRMYPVRRAVESA